tara:strand:- start:4055 stop:4777 length:723 start_codon:yes stop_codon:yes gene_type:complete
MKPTGLTIALLLSPLALASLPLSAELTTPAISTSANVTLTSDYVFRGISQSSENIAIQGGLDVGHSSGAYAGVWASSVDFDDGNENGTVELDIYAGFATSIDEVTLDAAFLHYDYPGSGNADFDYQELAVSMAYDFVSLSLNYSPDYFGEAGEFWYPALSVSHTLPMGLTISGSAGYNAIDEEDTFGTDDYTDWSIYVSKTLAGLDATVGYTDTDLDSGECFGGSGLCDPRVVFSVSRSF